MADEYIKREDALAALCRDCDKMVPSDEREPCRYRFTGCMEYYNIFELPATDVRPVVRGRWRANGKFENCENCTLCGCAVLKAEYDPILRINGKYSYCPNCGADMREVTPDG